MPRTSPRREALLSAVTDYLRRGKLLPLNCVLADELGLNVGTISCYMTELRKQGWKLNLIYGEGYEIKRPPLQRIVRDRIAARREEAATAASVRKASETVKVKQPHAKIGVPNWDMLLVTQCLNTVTFIVIALKLTGVL